MRKSDLESAADMIEKAAEAVEVILAEGVAAAMNRFNRRATTTADGENVVEHDPCLLYTSRCV